jgi:hypothetical protein
MSEISENNQSISNYVPSDLEIDDVSFQVPDSITRDDIISTLIKTNGDVVEAVLTILTNDNVIPQQLSPKRMTQRTEIAEWNKLYKDIDKYNIENNIERVKDASVSH